MYDSQAEEQQWVIWNGSLGLLDTVSIGEVEVRQDGRHAWLEEPYDMVGPFSFDELETAGVISFAACVVMSRQLWQRDQVALRKEALKNRREAQARIEELNARLNERQQQREQQRSPFRFQPVSDKQHRELLNLPVDGLLQASQIKAAYRRLAQKTHPDVGGDHEQFVQITEARDALLARF